jgi:predicted alpha-1,6-mannanase (GH76 family)
VKWREFKKRMERQYWEEMLANHTTVAAAAKAAGVNRQNAHRRLKQLGVEGMYTRKGQGGNSAWRSIGA